ncbi:MAG: FKBP-type peptidyl-prolyl cis-trans isomerase [Chitinispirillia bacterium]|nr:FKBP-type peptidyl-prolyl cis-trans isomerase [Chitinispirillia bacterium]
MKVFKVLAPAAAALALMVSCENGRVAEKPVDLNDERQKISYAIGRDIASNIKEADSLDIEALILALREALDGKPSQISDSAISVLNRRVQIEIREKQMRARRKLEEDKLADATAFLEKNKTAEGVKVTESGLQYIVLAEGKGATPKPSDQVKVHYHGTLPDGTVFDSSRDRGEPTSFTVTGVIRGWTEALQLMKTGGKMKIFVPPDLAYGRRGPRNIGPNATLIFEIELLEIIKPETQK